MIRLQVFRGTQTGKWHVRSLDGSVLRKDGSFGSRSLHGYLKTSRREAIQYMKGIFKKVRKTKSPSRLEARNFSCDIYEEFDAE